MAAPEVKATVKVIPAKRKATFDVPVPTKDRPNARISAEVQLRQVTMWGGVDFGRGAIVLPRSLAAVDLVALLGAVRGELVEQGVES